MLIELISKGAVAAVAALRPFLAFGVLASAGNHSLAQPPPSTTPSVLSEFLLDVGAEKFEIPYLGQLRSAFGSDGTPTLTLMPAGAVYFDRERSKGEGKLCVNYELSSARYLDAFNKVASGSPGKLLVAKAQSLTLHLAPIDESEPPYSWVPPRADHAAGPLAAEFRTCFDVGAGRDPEAVAHTSMVRAYYTTPALQGQVSKCAASVSLKEVQSRVIDAGSVVTSGSGPSVLLTGAQLSELVTSNAATIDISCASSDQEAVKIVREQLNAALPNILARLQTQEATWEQLKGNMWSLGFSTQADTVIEKLIKHVKKTETTKDLGLTAKDLGALGITANDGRKVTEENESSETTKVTIPASIRVYRLSKSDMVFSASVAARELYVTGKTAATMLLRSRFVEDGVLRTVKQSSLAQFPPNAIVAWFGNQAKDLPSGWAFCDGQVYAGAAGVEVRTPDLRGRFLREAAGLVGSTGGHESVEAIVSATTTALRVSLTTGDHVCTKVHNKTGDCLASVPNPHALTSVSVPAKLPTIPPYVGVAYICKLP